MKISDMTGIALAIIVISSTSGVGALVLGALYNSTSDSTAQTVITNSKTAISNLNSQLGTYGTVSGVMILLFVVLTQFGSTGRGGI